MTRLGLLLPTFEGALGDQLELAVAAEAAGFDGVWLPDSPTQYRVPDPLAVLGALAVRTSRVTIGTAVLVAPLRAPVLLAQAFTTADALSGGRVVAGLGAGFGSPDSAAQFAAVGADFARRGTVLAETVATLRRCWADGTVSAPARPGGPPVWLAGAGARAEARAGRLADGWLPYLPDPCAYAEGWARVRAAATEAGRAAPPVAGLYLTVAFGGRDVLDGALRRWYGRGLDVVSTFQSTYAGPPDGLAEHLAPYRAAGLEALVVRSADADPRAALETIRAAVAS